jgi:hypothetical protein
MFIMPYPIMPSEIKLSYQVYAGNNPEPKDAVLLTMDSDQMFAQDLIDDLAGKGIWNETLETQLENKQLYFKVFRGDEGMISVDAIEFDNIRMLPNRGLLSLEKPLQQTISNSMSWLGSFIPDRVKQTVYGFGNQIAEWAEDKLTGLPTYSSNPKVEMMDEKEWREIVKENVKDSELFHSTCHDAETEKESCHEGDNTQAITSTSISYFDSILNTTLGAITYVANNPIKTLVLALAASSVVSRIHLPKINFENHQTQFSNTINTATNVLTRLAVAKIATNGIYAGAPLNTIITGIALSNPVAAQPWRAAYPNSYNLANLNKQSGTKFSGVLMSSIYTGFSVTAVGDVNGDGKPDFLIGSDGDNSNTGAAYLVYGGPWLSDSTFLLSSLNGTTGVKILGVSVNDYTAWSLSSAGDVNGDGKSDFLIGVRGANNFVGAAYLIYGGGVWLNTPTFSLANINGVNGVKFLGFTTYNQVGVALSLVGDVNGDGRPDFLIGSCYFAGAAGGGGYLIYGGPWLNMPTFSLANLNGINGVKFIGVATADEAGVALSPAGDLNGDGKADFLIAAQNADTTIGAVYLVYSGPWLNAPTFSFSSLNGINGVKLTGISAGDTTGCAISFAGDVNGDGKPDFLISACTAYSSSGVIYLVYGGPWLNVPVFPLANLNGTTGVRFLGALPGDSAAIPNSAGDFNGDGIPDILIGAPGANGNNGIAYLIFGSPQLNIPVFPLANLNSATGIKFLGVAGDLAGSPVSPAGDINGDGADDIFIGAYRLDGNVGSAYLINGFGFTLWSNKLSLSRGDTVIVRSSMLNTTGIANPAHLIFTANNLQHGQFELVSNPGQSIVRFTQQQINQAQIQFVQDGSGFPPMYSIGVSMDTSIATISPVAAQISFTQTPPLLINNTLAITQGQSVILSSVQLGSMSIPYPNPIHRLFNISNIQHGCFELTTQPNQTITIFTQQQINQKQIQFIHDGSCETPAIAVRLSDPGMTLQPALVNVSFELFAHTLSNNRLAIYQGQTLILNQNELASIGFNYEDTQNLQFLITDPSHIRFSNLSFFQRDILLGKIEVTHDGSLFAPSYNVSLINCGNTYGPWLATINFANSNDMPILMGTGCALNYIERTSAIIIDPNILVFDPENAIVNASISITNSYFSDQDRLEFINQNGITGIFYNANGNLVLTGISSAANYQAAIRNVTYFNLSYNVSSSSRTVAFVINNAKLSSNVVTRILNVIPVNDLPVLRTNTLTIHQGQTITLTTDQLFATDLDAAPYQLRFLPSSVQHGRFERVSARGIAILSPNFFTQQEVINGQVCFVQDATIMAPSYSISVSDGIFTTSPANAVVNFIGTPTPVITANKLTIHQHETVIITTADLNVVDSNAAANKLIFAISNIHHGRFSFVNTPSVIITSFSLQDVLNGKIQFTQDGTEVMPSYDVSASDGTQSTTISFAIITYINVNDAPIVENVIPDRSEIVGQNFSFTIPPNTFYDPDNDLLTYKAQQEDGKALPDWIMFEAKSRLFTVAPREVGKNRFSVFATDPSGLFAVANFTIQVKKPQNYPNPLDPWLVIKIVSIICSIVGSISTGLITMSLVKKHYRKNVLVIETARHLKLKLEYELDITKEGEAFKKAINGMKSLLENEGNFNDVFYLPSSPNCFSCICLCAEEVAKAKENEEKIMELKKIAIALAEAIREMPRKIISYKDDSLSCEKDIIQNCCYPVLFSCYSSAPGVYDISPDELEGKQESIVHRTGVIYEIIKVCNIYISKEEREIHDNFIGDIDNHSAYIFVTGNNKLFYSKTGKELSQVRFKETKDVMEFSDELLGNLNIDLQSLQPGVLRRVGQLDDETQKTILSYTGHTHVLNKKTYLERTKNWADDRISAVSQRAIGFFKVRCCNADNFDHTQLVQIPSDTPLATGESVQPPDSKDDGIGVGAPQQKIS